VLDGLLTKEPEKRPTAAQVSGSAAGQRVPPCLLQLTRCTLKPDQHSWWVPRCACLYTRHFVNNNQPGLPCVQLLFYPWVAEREGDGGGCRTGFAAMSFQLDRMDDAPSMETWIHDMVGAATAVPWLYTLSIAVVFLVCLEGLLRT
jgi:hypothetical protein